MNNSKEKSPHNQLAAKINVKSSNSRINSVGNNCDEKVVSFYRTFKSLYTFSRLVGLMPFSIVLSANGNIITTKVTVHDIIWMVISVAWYIMLAAIAGWSLQLPRGPNESLTINVGDTLLLIVGLCIGVLSILMDMFNRNKLINISQKYEIFDYEVSPHSTAVLLK